MRHPDERQIALFAGNDAGWLERVWVGRHVGGCSSCRALVEAFRRDRQAIRREAGELPENFDWSRLAAEMTGNIRVGLAAGQCISARSKTHGIAWRPVLAGTGLLVLLLSSWALKFPGEQRVSLARGFERLWSHPRSVIEPGVALEATRSGIQVSENGSALTMMHPGSAIPVVVVSTRGSMRARYVDSDTGQVTITNVYAQ